MKVIVQQKRHAQEILELEAAIAARDYLATWELTAPLFHDPVAAASHRKHIFAHEFDRIITKGGIN